MDLLQTLALFQRVAETGSFTRTADALDMSTSSVSAAIQRLERHLGAPLGYYTTEVGDVNEVVHIWQYADAADRERRRAALESDPQWLAYRRAAASQNHVIKQTNALLKSVDFSAFDASPLTTNPEGAPR